MDVPELLDLASAYWKSATLTAGVELNVFGFVADGPKSAETIAAACETSPKYTTALLDGLASLELLEKSDAGYRIAPELQSTLDPASPDSLIGALRFNAQMMPLWGRLSDCVRVGTPAIPPNAQLGSDPALVGHFVRGMHSRARVLAPGILPHIDLDGVHDLLDVAAGPGTFSAMLAEPHEGIQLTVFDLPAVSAVSRELHAEGPVGDRMTFASGDYHSDPLPASTAADGHYDAAFYCGAVHQEDEEHTRLVLGKIHDVLRPGGRLFLVDLMLDKTRTRPAFSALFEINMMLTNSMSHVHAIPHAKALVEEAGFADVSAKELLNTPYALIQGLRPEDS